ncbi:MAG: hypothetical protein DI598_01490 [Pseudopedobacter saltans]|uniref:TonB-dependent receptor n=1 Tax=Pseudopedobacter saltans TaxID=151895 RepID=A0A2W5F7Y9_9SPHI|nr:MAG: hypothetical protein DI598_01490 [Pseudopedobacter saltans]
MKKISISLFLLVPITVFSQVSESLEKFNPVTQLDSVTVQSNIEGKTQKYGNGYTRTEKLLETIPGISLVNRGNYAQEPIIRGFSDGQTMLTLNGMHVFGACTDKMDPSTSYLEPSNLQKINLVTGPAFGIGGSSIGGGLQFILKEAQTGMLSKWTSMLSSQYEINGNMHQLLGQVHYSAQRWAVLIDALYRKANDYSPGGDKSENITKYGQWQSSQVFTINDAGKVNFSQYSKWNVHVNSVYKFSDNRVLKLDYLHDDGNNIGYPALSMDVKYARSNIMGLHYIENNANKRISYWETAAYYNKINHVMDDTKRPLDQLPMHMDMPAWSDTKGLFSQIFWELTNHQKLKIKVETYNNRWHAEMTMFPKNGGASMFMLTIPDAQRTMIGTDLEDHIHINEKWKLIAGGHLEYNKSDIFSDAGMKQLSTITTENSSTQHLLYNLYGNLQFNLSESVSTNLSISRSMRAPTLRETYALYLFNPMDNFDYIGNTNLKRESAWNIEWSWLYRTIKWNINVKAYSYFLQNYIAGILASNYNPMTESASGVKQFSNIPNATIMGMEATFQYLLSKKWTINSYNSYGYGKDNYKRALPLIQSLRSSNTLQWSPKETLQFYIENLSTIRQNHVSSFYGEKETPGFAIFHVGANKKLTFNHQIFSIGMDVRNIFNKYYFEHLDVVQLPRQGRNIQFRITYQF